jgi:hypothetical protein
MSRKDDKKAALKALKMACGQPQPIPEATDFFRLIHPLSKRLRIVTQWNGIRHSVADVYSTVLCTDPVVFGKIQRCGSYETEEQARRGHFEFIRAFTLSVETITEELKNENT